MAQVSFSRLARDRILTASGMGLTSAAGFFALVSAVPLGAAETNSLQAAAPEPPEPRLEEVLKLEIPTVEGASKYRQKTTEAPSSVTILTSEDVKRYGYRTLADILQSAHGLYVSEDRNYSFLGIRGFNRGDYNSRVLVLVDGHRINNSLSDGAAIGTDFILDVDLIDKVEIIRGPGSSLYGDNAFFGVVNVITRKGRDVDGGEVSGEAASFDTYKGRATYGHKFRNGLDVMLSGSWYESEGPRNLYYPEFDQRISSNPQAANNGIAHKKDDDQYRSFFGTLAFHDLSLQGAWIDRQKGNPTAQYFTTFNDPHLRTDDERSYVNLKYDHEFPDIVDVHAQVYYDRYDFNVGYPSFGQLFDEVRAAQWWGAELQLTKELFERHKLIFGAEYRDDFRQSDHNFNVAMPNVPAVERSRDNYGFYLQGEAAVLTNLHLNAGFRYDQYGKLDPTVNPRVAVIGDPFEKTTLKFIYGSAFRAPNFFELIDPLVQDLKPETITTYEGIYEQGIGKHFRSSASVFYNQIEDLITFDSVAGRYRNLSGADSKGGEAELQAFWASGWRGRLSYTYQRTTDTTTGQRLTDSPQHLGKFNLSAPLLKDKIFASLEVQYTSARKTLPTLASPSGSEAAGFGVLNFTLFSQKLVKGLEASVSIYNLLDKRYADPATPSHVQDTLEQNGRVVRGKVTYHF